jgi:hypothetical protein
VHLVQIRQFASVERLPFVEYPNEVLHRTVAELEFAGDFHAMIPMRKR